ncbi:MAG: GNAT family N-acetyltransferase, partial [Actinocrinis sp.]
MTWQLTDDLAVFDAAARAFIETKPLEHTLLISVPAGLRERGPHAYGSGDPRFGWYETADGSVVGAFVQTPPHPLLMTGLPAQAAESLPDALLGAGRTLSGLNGPAGVAKTVAATWCARTGDSQTVYETHRLYVLDDLIEPVPALPGSARIAVERDRGLLTTWYGAFAEELGEHVLNVQRVIEDRLEFGGLILWEVDDVPVSMA